jgi:hypothetical protein
MEWHEIIIMIPLVILGIYLRGKFYEHKNGYYNRDDWRDKKKDRY